MIDFEELAENGWIYVKGITNARELLELGKTIGTPVLSPNNELVKEIKVTSSSKAIPGSQSFLYNKGPFPLHTDTVFLPVPVRYVILRGYGDTRRPTTVTTFENLLKKCDKKLIEYMKKSIWLTGVNTKKFYCSILFQKDYNNGMRFDTDLMVPVNKAAKEIEIDLRELVNTKFTEKINWTDDCAVIISNWKTLHGRGSEPPNEQERTIERLYVR